MKRKQTKKTNHLNEKLNHIFELPQEVVGNAPRLTIVGFEQLLIENYKGILEYEDFFIKINTHIGALNINGFNLNLKQMTEDDIMISGKIESVDLERTFDEED